MKALAIATTAIAAAWLFASAAAQAPHPDPALESELQQAPLEDYGAALPDDPAKPLVYARCDHCHSLHWVGNSGATEQGWTDRIRRMNRAGAMIPPEEIPVLAAYLARARPERPRPAPPPKHGASARKH